MILDPSTQLRASLRLSIRKWRKEILLGVILIIGVVIVVRNRTQEIDFEKLKISQARAIEFLGRNQLPNGAWPSSLCLGPMMRVCLADISPYITTFVAHSLGVTPPNLPSREGRGIDILPLTKGELEGVGAKERALEFLYQNAEEGMVWRFWGKEDPKHLLLPLDMDDTVTARSVLLENDYKLEGLAPLDEFRNENGLYYLWLTKKASEMPNKEHENEVSCEVNTNVLYYLTLQKENNGQICEYINKAILENKLRECLKYSETNYPFYYLVTRARSDGKVECLEQSIPKIIENIKQGQRLDGSWGSDQDTALAIASLENAGYFGSEVVRGLNYLLREQKINGSWERGAFFFDVKGGNYWGSEALTTAIAIEAMGKYLK